MFTRVWKLFIVLSISHFNFIRCDVKLDAMVKTGKISTVFSTPGLHRPYMEDKFIRYEGESDSGIGLYAIFDGHSGNYSSIFAQRYLFEAIANELEIHASDREYSLYTEGPDEKLDFKHMFTDFIDRAEYHLKNATQHNMHKSGTTCLMVIAEEKKLTVANVGDSRGVMCNSAGRAIDLSVDHKPNSAGEKERIEGAGEKIYGSSLGIWRVRGLAMSRSLGDNVAKRNDNVIIATPDIKTFHLDEHKPLFMILASDGLWDVMSSQFAVDFIKERYLKESDFGAQDLVIEALNRESKDNITVIIVKFKNGHYDVASASA